MVIAVEEQRAGAVRGGSARGYMLYMSEPTVG